MDQAAFSLHVGSYPKTLADLFSNEKPLNQYVIEECKKQNIKHEPVAQEMIKMEMEPEINVDFHEELKFTVKVYIYICMTTIIVIF